VPENDWLRGYISPHAENASRLKIESRAVARQLLHGDKSINFWHEQKTMRSRSGYL
jgi:hypothetical protein